MTIDQPLLRWPVPLSLTALLPGQTLRHVKRRAKYLLLTFDKGTLIIHLGMSGSLRVLPANTPMLRHDHIDILFGNQSLLRLTDPRRFGGMLWTQEPPMEHKLLRHLGPEPLSDSFDADWLHARTRSRKRTIKSLLMDARIVVGVGNIYANEALFMAGIRPDRRCETLPFAACQTLTAAVKKVLQQAIKAGGTSFRNFVNSHGQPGWFAIELCVYGRACQPCTRCAGRVQGTRLHNRSTFFCPDCQH